MKRQQTCVSTWSWTKQWYELPILPEKVLGNEIGRDEVSTKEGMDSGCHTLGMGIYCMGTSRVTAEFITSGINSRDSHFRRKKNIQCLHLVSRGQVGDQ